MGTKTVRELADLISLEPHPSRRELGPLASGISERKGIWSWHPESLTRLELPSSVTGFGTLWIDYDTGRDARAAYDRVVSAVLATTTPEEAFEAIRRFFDEA